MAGEAGSCGHPSLQYFTVGTHHLWQPSQLGKRLSGDFRVHFHRKRQKLPENTLPSSLMPSVKKARVGIRIEGQRNSQDRPEAQALRSLSRRAGSTNQGSTPTLSLATKAI